MNKCYSDVVDIYFHGMINPADICYCNAHFVNGDHINPHNTAPEICIQFSLTGPPFTNMV